MFRRMKNIRLRPLLVHMIITLSYPAVKAFVSPGARLRIFTDAVTYIALVLVIGGIIYAMVLHGDFDISGFVFKRGARKNKQTFEAYMADRKAKREEAFNYPLFLGLVYLAGALVIAYGFF